MRGQCHAPAALYPRKDPVPIVQEAGWAPGLVWTGAKNLAPTGIRSPDRPARSQSLYLLRYPLHTEERGFHHFQYLFRCSIEILEEVWRIHLWQNGMQTSLVCLDTGLLKQTGLLEEQIVMTVQVIGILLHSFSWLGLKQGPYIIQCSVQKSSKEYTCYNSFRSEGEKRNLLLASQNHSYKHFSWSHHLEYFNIVGIIYSQSVQNL